MSIYPNITEHDLINLGKISEQQRNQRAPKIKNRFLKQTHDIRLAENISPIAKKLEGVKESTPNLGDVIKESQRETPQLSTENTQPQSPTENDHEDTQPAFLYDVSLEITLADLKEKEKVFFNLEQSPEGNLYWNNVLIELLGDSRVGIEGKNSNITLNLRNVFTDTNGNFFTKIDKTDNLTFKKLLKTLNYENSSPEAGKFNSDRCKHSKTIPEPIILRGHGIEIITIPSNIKDFYTRLEILLGSKTLSGQTDTLTEASNFKDEL